MANLAGIDISGFLGFLGTPQPAATQQAPATTTRTPTATPAPVSGDIARIPEPHQLVELQVGQGVGYAKGFWQVYFNQPSGSSDASTYVNGIDVPIAALIRQTTKTLDVVAFEMNNTVIEEAILDAHRRGVRVRVVTDDEHGIEDEKDFSIRNFIEAGIPVVDDSRSGLMHNKFMILDSNLVISGSWNFTVNDTYRNDNNALVLQSPQAVSAYQAEFDEMFINKRFGPTSPKGNNTSYTQNGVSVQILFAPEDPVTQAIVDEINRAQRTIKFMAFSFTENDIGDPMLARKDDGVTISGVFENRGSTTATAELPKFFCAGLEVRQDGNPYALHHKVIIVDDETVITGSFNFSGNAINVNDENLLIIKDKDLAQLYLQEFDRVWRLARRPTNITC